MPSESVFKALKDQKHVDIDPKACHEIVKLAVEAVNSVMNTEGPPGKEVNLLENDENLFERGLDVSMGPCLANPH